MIRNITLILGLALLCVFFSSADALAQKTMTIQVREASLRATPSHLGKITATATYGTQVTIVEQRGDWRRVSAAGGKTQGWLHATALTSKRITIAAGQTKTAASVSQDEIALAGKGFSKEVESEYRKTHRNLDYTWIDRMETRRVSEAQIQAFIKAGSLRGGTP